MRNGNDSAVSSHQSSSKHNKSIIEAFLFVAGEPVMLSSLVKTLDVHESEVRMLVEELMAEYRVRESGIVISEIADGYQMFTKPELALWIKRFKNINTSHKLSSAALETLSIIAYKQPITKLEIDQLRSVNSDGALKSILDKRLVKIVGKKDSPGRPFLYGTTRDFLQYFGLKNLTELPQINPILSDEAA